MRRNPGRRVALLNAAVEVLAREGARGLTFRAIDAEAGVPAGTASNYFPNRDALLDEVGRHVHARLAPDPETVAETLRRPRDRAAVARFMHDILARVAADPAGYLALLELRLESTRRPGLRKAFSETMGAQMEENVRFHTEAGLPGGREAVELLYVAMTGLIVEHLTLPDLLPRDAAERLVDALTARLTTSDS